MNKLIPLLLITGAVVLIGGYFIILRNKPGPDTDRTGSESITQSDRKMDGQDSFGLSVCEEVPKSLVTEAIGKQIEETESKSSGSGCTYYTNKAKLEHILIQVSNLSAENQKKGQQTLDRRITTDDSIPMEHFIAVQENGLINAIYLVMTPDKFVRVDRTAYTADNEHLVNLAIIVAKIITNR